MSTISGITEAMVDDRVIPAIRSILPALNAFSYKAEAGKIFGNKVNVPIGTDPTIGDKTLGTLGTRTGSLATEEIELDAKKEAVWGAVEGEIDSKLFEKYWLDKITGGVHGLGKNVVNAALALVTASNYGNDATTDKHVVALADFRQQDLAQIWKKAVVKIKEQGMSLGIGPGAAAAIFGETNLGQVFSNTGTNWFATGVVPQLIGLPTWMYTEFPDNSQHLEGAIFGKSAIGIALSTAEMLADSGEGNTIERRIITEPESGVQVLYTVGFDQGGQLSGSLWLMYGVKKIQDAVVRYVSA